MKRHNSYHLVTILFLLVIIGCKTGVEEVDPGDPVARVNDTYLYKSDIANLVRDNMSPQDSAVVVSAYIDRWAKQRLLLERSKFNLTMDTQKDFERMVDDYRVDLLTKAYKDRVIAKKLDTVISAKEIKDFYEQNIQNFKLNEDVVAFRYIILEAANPDLYTIKRQLSRYTDDDRELLNENLSAFSGYSFNDSLWMPPKRIMNKFTALNDRQESRLTRKQSTLQVKDGDSTYLIFIKDALKVGDYAPISYVEPTIRQIILNKRKLELTKELEKEITKDALNNKQFELYE
ncbi:hypothetical protein GCM10009117_11520 [Gangjinia marincola]|uniref:Peptidyl-prolyl cis-trans isomerase n=1 Tax=Gangjinia marincola TaxID=578463 RepID=A0ABN1MFW5_9FLAO